MRPLKFALTALVLWAGVASVSAQSAPSTTLEITATQGSVVDNAKNLVLLYCIANHLTIVNYELSMNLTVTVGDSRTRFQQNGTQQLRVEAADQNYSIGGRSVVAFSVINQRGGASSIRVVYSYVGDGTVHLGSSDANSAVRLELRTVNSRVVSMDLSSGEGETEETLSLNRS